jgi:hypothetical protein
MSSSSRRVCGVGERCVYRSLYGHANDSRDKHNTHLQYIHRGQKCAITPVHQREGRGATVHKYISFVHGDNSSQAGSKIPTMSEYISSL